MSNEVNEVTPQTVEPTAPTENTQEIERAVNPDAVVAKNKELLSKYKREQAEKERLLEENRTFKMADQERKGNTDAVIKALREENLALKTEKKQNKQEKAFATFSSQVKDLAKKRGCANPEKMFKLLGKEEMASIDTDENFNINADDANRLIDQLIADDDIGLFKSADVNVNTVNSGFKSNASASKGLKEMSKAEILLALKEL